MKDKCSNCRAESDGFSWISKDMFCSKPCEVIWRAKQADAAYKNSFWSKPFSEWPADVRAGYATVNIGEIA